MKDRIRQLMETKHLTQQRFAEMINISAASLSSIFNERTKPTLNHVDAIRQSFPDINLSWLLYGEGDMFVAPGQSALPHQEKQTSIPADDLMLDFDDTPTAPLQAGEDRVAANAPRNQSYRPEKVVVKTVDKPQRQISEIRIFYDDQTWETFVPKK